MARERCSCGGSAHSSRSLGPVLSAACDEARWIQTTVPLIADEARRVEETIEEATVHLSWRTRLHLADNAIVRSPPISRSWQHTCLMHCESSPGS